MSIIDIILPTLNRDYIIENTLRSIFSQSNPNWRLIIFDNGSSDGTESICRKFTYDKRVKYVHSENTLPVYDSWEKAISFVSSDYFIVFSDDDIMHEDFVEEFSKNKRKSQFELIVTNKGTCAPIDDKAVVRKKVTISKNISNKSFEFDPREIAVSYGSGQTVSVMNNIELHPSILIISKSLKDKIKNIYGKFYMAVSHDYFNGVMLGLYAKQALLIDKPLVIIGGYKILPYCFSSNKFEYFGMDFSRAKILLKKYSKVIPKLTEKLEKYWYLPYFSNNILKQTLLTLNELQKKDKEKYELFISILVEHQNKIVTFLDNSIIESYCVCRKLGDPLDKKIEVNLKTGKKRGKNIINDLVKWLLSNLNKNQNFIVSRFLCIIYNTVSKDTRWYYYSKLHDICKMRFK